LRFRCCAAFVAALILYGGGSPAAHADESPPRWEGQVKAVLMYFRYEEFQDDGGILDRETGILPGVSAGLGRLLGPWGIHGELTVNVGTADYTGETTGPNPSIPVRTQTSERIVDARTWVERWSSRDANWRAAGYAGIGYRGWNRDISATRVGSLLVGAVTEYYETGYGMLGAKAVAGAPSSQWTLDLRIQRTLRPRVQVRETELNDALTLPLGPRTSPAASLGWQSRRASGTVIGVEVFVEQWDFGRSDLTPMTVGGAPAGLVYEPESRTRSYGLRVGITSAF